MRFQFARLPVLLFSIFLILSVFLGNANAGEPEYVRELAPEIVKNLEKQIKADEMMVSLYLIKTKKDGKIIPLRRMLRRELKKYLEGSVIATIHVESTQEITHTIPFNSNPVFSLANL